MRNYCWMLYFGLGKALWWLQGLLQIVHYDQWLVGWEITCALWFVMSHGVAVLVCVALAWCKNVGNVLNVLQDLFLLDTKVKLVTVLVVALQVIQHLLYRYMQCNPVSHFPVAGYELPSVLTLVCCRMLTLKYTRTWMKGPITWWITFATTCEDKNLPWDP